MRHEFISHDCQVSTKRTPQTIVDVGKRENLKRVIESALCSLPKRNKLEDIEIPPIVPEIPSSPSDDVSEPSTVLLDSADTNSIGTVDLDDSIELQSEDSVEHSPEQELEVHSVRILQHPMSPSILEKLVSDKDQVALKGSSIPTPEGYSPGKDISGLKNTFLSGYSQDSKERNTVFVKHTLPNLDGKTPQQVTFRDPPPGDLVKLSENNTQNDDKPAQTNSLSSSQTISTSVANQSTLRLIGMIPKHILDAPKPPPNSPNFQYLHPSIPTKPPIVGQNGMKYFPCNECDEIFDTRGKRYVHQKNVHAQVYHFNFPDEGGFEINRGEPFKCPRCNHLATSYRMLHLHTKRCLKTGLDIFGPFKFNCTQCEEIFASEHDRNTHFQNVHRTVFLIKFSDGGNRH
ncbi:hypothetical protein HK103_003172 [Boothiomyces macroporosus]|uniref:C2H2-type domain-containing protein n=1 Tax=Boothiomyces macroporosus TaxID=261099 RepID=A0AAD5U8T1_9FUNG|nr:hypothetical protein HK103_003172 [Boothiomyces macroporosus]